MLQMTYCPTSLLVPHPCFHVSSPILTFLIDRIQFKALTFIYRPYTGQAPLILMTVCACCPPSLIWPTWSLCNANKDFFWLKHKPLHWPTTKPTPSFDTPFLIYWWARRLFPLCCLWVLYRKHLWLVCNGRRYINLQIQYNILYAHTWIQTLHTHILCPSIHLSMLHQSIHLYITLSIHT